MYSTGAVPLNFYTNSGLRMTITSGGQVGIGTASPDSYYTTNFVIANTSSGASSGITLANANNGQGRIDFADGTSGAAQYRGTIAYTHDSTAADGYMRFSAGGTEVARFLGNKSVSIGGSSPATRFEVYQSTTARNSASNLLTIHHPSSNNPYSGFGMGLLFRGTDYSNVTQKFGQIMCVIDSTDSSSNSGGDPGFGAGMRFYTGTNGAINEVGRVNSSGGWSFGGTSADDIVHIHAGARGLKITGS